VINPRTILGEWVTALQSCPDLVAALGGDGDNIRAFLEGLASDNNLRLAILQMPPGSILVARNKPQHFERTWEVTAADIRWSDALYPLAQHAMQRGYYMPNRNSIHCSRHHCPYWRRCEQDFGGIMEP
jgi:hypothetical protein